MKFRRIAALVAAVLTAIAITGCKDNSDKFYSEGDFTEISKNPEGKITISYTLDGSRKRETLDFTLYYRQAPITVTNFVYLVKQGYYDGLLFHMLVSGDAKPNVLQGGAYINAYGEDGKRSGMTERNPLDYTIKGEFSANGWTGNSGLTHENGAMAMARTTKYDSASNQFYISIGENPSLDKEYAVFGKITSNASVLTGDIRNLPTQTVNGDLIHENVPTEDVIIESITVDTFGADFGVPRMLKK